VSRAEEQRDEESQGGDEHSAPREREQLVHVVNIGNGHVPRV
jgi:hypothetical protein